MTVSLMACGGTQTDQSEGLNQQDTSSLKAFPRTEGGGQVAKPVKADKGDAQTAKSQQGEATLPLEEGGGQLTENSNDDNGILEGRVVPNDEGGGQFAEPAEQEESKIAKPVNVDEGGGQFTDSEEQLKIAAAQPLEEGGGQFTLEGNVLVFRGTAPEGVFDGLLLINGKDYIKLQINKDGTVVMTIELTDEDVNQMTFQTVFKGEVRTFILQKGKVTEVTEAFTGKK